MKQKISILIIFLLILNVLLFNLSSVVNAQEDDVDELEQLLNDENANEQTWDNWNNNENEWWMNIEENNSLGNNTSNKEENTESQEDTQQDNASVNNDTNFSEEQENINWWQEQNNMQNDVDESDLWIQNKIYIADMQLTPTEVDDKWNISNSIIIRWELDKFVKAGENAILIVKFTPWKFDAAQNKVIPDLSYKWTIKASDVKVYLINEWVPTEVSKDKIMFIAPDWTQIQADWKTEVDILNNALQIELDNPVWQELEIQLDFKNDNAVELEKLKWNLVAEISRMKLWWTEDTQIVAVAQLPPEEIKPNQPQEQEQKQNNAKNIAKKETWIEENILFLIFLLIITLLSYKMYYKE